jgi:transposase
VVAAVVEEGQPHTAAARRFAVGRSTVYRWVDVAEGRLAAKPMRGGPKPVIRDEVEAVLRRLVAENNQLTQAEYRDRLASQTLGRALRRLRLTRKKEDAARRRAGQRRGAGGAPSLA